MIRILIAEDDKHIALLMERFLQRHGYHVETCTNGESALEQLQSIQYDLLVSDVMMPKMDGYALTQAVREYFPNLPILMVTAKESLADKKAGFAAGTDDYLVKPIELDELLLRIQALLRRAQVVQVHELCVGSSSLNEQQLTLKVGEETIPLAQKECAILFKLLSYPEKIFTRFQLVDAIWGFDAEIDERTIDVHIKRLREKLGENPDFEVVTVRGLGYKVVKR